MLLNKSSRDPPLFAFVAAVASSKGESLDLFCNGAVSAADVSGMGAVADAGAAADPGGGAVADAGVAERAAAAGPRVRAVAAAGVAEVPAGAEAGCVV